MEARSRDSAEANNRHEKRNGERVANDFVAFADHGAPVALAMAAQISP